MTSRRILVQRVAGALTVAVVIAAVALGGTKPTTVDLQPSTITVEARPITSFDPAPPEETHFGKLTWRGGLVLKSAAKNFGGWSGLIVDATGKGYFAISDAGSWMSGTLDYDEAGKLTGL